MHVSTLFVFTFSCTCLIQVESELDVDALKMDIASTLRCRNNVALSVSIVKDNRIVLAEGFGIVDKDSKKEVTNSTLFGIASLSKAFASTLLLKLLHKSGKYSIETKVIDILGDDFGLSEEWKTKHTTIEDILSHRTGMVPNNFLRFDTNLTRENLPRRIKLLPATGTWRGSYIYNNLMYGIVTRVAEVLGGATWEELVKRELFEPLGMTSSAFATTLDFQSGNIAMPYDGNPANGQLTPVNLELTKRWAMLCGSGCVMSTATDISNWMRFNLNLGLTPSGERLMPQDVMKELYVPRTAMTSKPLTYFVKPDVPYTTSFSVYGLGWRRGSYRGYQTIVHSGSTFGYRALLTLFPSEKLGIFTAMTGHDSRYCYRMSLHNYIADKVLGEDPWLNVSTICSFPSPWFNKPKSFERSYIQSNKLSRDHSEYEGVFNSAAFGDIVVYYDIGDSMLKLNYGFGNWTLYQQDGDEFYGEGFGVNQVKKLGRLIFSRKDNSKVFVEIVLKDIEKRFPPVFVRRGFEMSHTNSGVKIATIWFLAFVCFAFTFI